MSTQSEATKDLVIVLLAAPFLMAFAAFCSAWPLMLGLGVIHSQITTHVPALGFWSVLALSWATGALVGKLKPASYKRGAK